MVTKLSGQYLKSGSIPTTALSGGVVSSSAQVVAALPTGALSSSAQVNYGELQNIPTDIVSSSTQVTAFLPTDTVSSSVQVTAFLPVGTVSSSGQVDFGTISNKPTLVSASSQITVVDTIGGDGLATTGSNTFTGVTSFSDTSNSTSYLDGAVRVAGGMSIQKDLRISGSVNINGLLTVVSMSSQYVTSSQYNVGVSKITVNDDDNVRFAGFSVFDSGSSNATASIYWDSLQHRFLYENLSGSAYNSAILIAGPKNTGSLGQEVGLTSGYIPVATGDDHIDNSVMYQSGSNIGVGVVNPSATFQVQGNVSASSFTGSLSGTVVTAAQTNITSVGTLSSLTVSGDLTVDTSTLKVDSTNNRVGIGTASPGTPLHLEYAPGVTPMRFQTNAASSPDDIIGGLIFFNETDSVARISVRQGTTASDGYIEFGTEEAGGIITEKMRITASGPVIIGNGDTDASPATAFLRGTNGSGTNIAGAEFRITGGRGTGAGAGGSITFYTSAAGASGTTLRTASERVRIDSSGNLLIGTTVLTDISSSGSGNEGAFIGPDGYLGIARSNDILATLNRKTSHGVVFDIRYNGTTVGAIGTTADGLYFGAGSSSTEVMRITSAGNVGIGTTNPITTFQVNGATLESLGNVMLNDTSTAAAGVGGGLLLGGKYLSGGSYTQFAAIQGLKENSTDGNYDGALRFMTRRFSGNLWLEHMRISSAGNVGIGTTNPSYQLDLGGGTTVSERIRLQRGSDDTNQYTTMGYTRIYPTRATVGLASAQTEFGITQVGSDGSRTPFLVTTAGTIQTLNTISVGNATPSTSGAGITFPATQNDSSNANTLDDYEEGTWTPVATRDSSAPSLTYTVQTGTYTKVGRMVIANCRIVINAVSSAGSGNTTITGLPFSSGEGEYSGQGIIGYNDALVNTVYSAWTSGTTIYFKSGTRGSGNDVGGWSAGGYLNLTMVYRN